VPCIVVLQDVELIPVVELEPTAFGASGRSLPSGTYQEMPEEWYRYWLESLVDSRVTGLMPIQRGSWHVPTSEFTDTVILGRVEVIFQNWLEKELEPVWGPLLGGLALRCQSQNVLIEPTCCGDLANIAYWREATGYRQSKWHPLWIGHPSLSVLYRAPRLIISSPHDAEPPTASWAVCPDRLEAAVAAAQIELEQFAEQIAPVLPPAYGANARAISRTMAGLGQ
jgi:hypothetical protein